GNITLKRGVTQSFDLIDWLKKVENGVIERANVSITLQDENHQEVLKWNLFEAWPCKWTGPDLKASADEMAIETLEICIERLETQKV
ncbi:phage tail protein, partial [candidate division KSB1 bacterium]|nr:phage tail protein [candidate division KSB1 bacterium]NIV70092.1 phage tail protein [Phycisphaerae bacterium]NIS28048.1 phage tail protein [candidate division KSB1 bacterium]NIT74919.1 phage tail protein [candidate division KSB1 bacterium]NIU28703.1 phage tail protein [candidate division KSB1 bacterium]